MNSKKENSEEGQSQIEHPSPSPVGRRYHRRRGDIHGVEESSHIWLVSFTDIMALMLTFFVLLFSMTEPAPKNWSEMSSSMQGEFNKFYGAVSNRGPQDFVNIAKINFNQALNIAYLNALMETVIAENPSLADVKITRQAGQLVMSMPHDLLFDAGDAQVREQGKKTLYALGGALSRIKNRIEISGNADPRAVSENGEAYESNWELSLARAANVAAILQSVGYDSDIIVRGHSSGRYDDLHQVKDEALRLELARRVDIVVLDHDGSKQKVFFDPDAE